MANANDLTVLCIGAGPAGLTAGYLLSRQGVAVTVIERDPVYVGGISRTVQYKGFHFDIGGHRFFSKAQEVEALWTEILGDDFISPEDILKVWLWSPPPPNLRQAHLPRRFCVRVLPLTLVGVVMEWLIWGRRKSMNSG